MDYIKEFEITKQKIRDVNGQILREDINLPLENKDEAEYYETEFGLKITNELFDFYSQMDGLDFEWERNENGKTLSGFAGIQDIMTLAENENENTLWADWYEKEDIIEIQKHYIFEKIVGTDNYITIKLNTDLTYQLFYVAEGSVNFGGSKKLPEIPLTIEEYFLVLCSCYFSFDIRHHLHKKEFYSNPTEVVPKLKELEAIFGKIELPKT